MYAIHSDWSEVERELKRLKRIPMEPDKQRLNRVLDRGFSITQTDTHIETGSLRLSGETSSVMLLGRYSGTITYGGESGWVNDPVDYAVYEQDRGGHHNFMGGLYVLHPMWIDAIKEIISK